MLKRKPRQVITFLLVVFLLFGIGYSAFCAESTLDKVRKSGKLRINVMIGEAPGFIKDPKTGEWSGHFIDIAEEIAKALNVELVPVDTTWGSVAMDLQANNIDMAIGVNPTASRAVVIDYTWHPIYYNSFVVVTRKDFGEINNWSDINKPDVKIGVEIGSSHDAIATRYTPNANIIRFRNRDETLLALESGRIDVLINTLFNSLIAAKERTTLGKVYVPKPIAVAPCGIGIVREAGDKAWQNFLSVMALNLQSSGFSRAAILKNLKKYGIDATDIPGDVNI